MKVGGGLNYVVGPMGAGKSLYAVRRIVAAVIHRQYAITNVQLYEDAPERIAWHVCKTSRAKRLRVADNVRRFYVYETELQEAMRYRVPGRGEARAIFAWDEGHNDLNNRDWRKDGRAELLEWATQLRKLGFVGYLLSQHADNTDAALRRVCNFAIRLQNQREQTRVLGLRVSPWPLFLAAWYPAHVPVAMTKGNAPMKIERYFLDYHRKLYDTFGLYHGLAGDLEENSPVIVLPPEGRVAPKALPAAGEVIDLQPEAVRDLDVLSQHVGRTMTMACNDSAVRVPVYIEGTESPRVAGTTGGVAQEVLAPMQHEPIRRPFRLEQSKVASGFSLAETRWEHRDARSFVSLDAAIRAAERDYGDDGWIATIKQEGEVVWHTLDGFARHGA